MQAFMTRHVERRHLRILRCIRYMQNNELTSVNVNQLHDRTVVYGLCRSVARCSKKDSEPALIRPQTSLTLAGRVPLKDMGNPNKRLI